MPWLEATITELNRYLGLPAATNPEQRASALVYISECQLALERPNEARATALHALSEHSLAQSGKEPGGSGSEAAAGAGEYLQPWEPWLALARASHWLEDWPAAYWGATRAMAAANQSAPQLGGRGSLGAEPHDVAALSAFYMGLHQVAVAHGEAALALSPHDERLQSNLLFYRQAATGAGDVGSAQPDEASLLRS